MTKSRVIDTQWWLMYCDLPDLNWARLRVFDDGSADILDCDGLKHFRDAEDARLDLLEDEFVRLDEIDEDDDFDFSVPLGQLRPPSAPTDRELVPLMLVRRW